MRTLNVSISDKEFNKFGLQQEELTFDSLVILIRRQLMRENLDRCVELAEKHNLSKMTMDEISAEVKAVRQNAKSRN
ncbi:MAG TPA: hypothetical protein VF610_08495 [Segetibacter sp.]|jgi:tRNA splicing ligase